MLPVIYSEEFLKHDTGPSHLERPQRLSAIVNALKTVSWSDRLSWQLPTPIETRDVMPMLLKVHEREHVERVKRLAETEGSRLDPDTPVSRSSYDVALLAVSAWLDGIDRVMENNAPAFVLARPPGHHASENRAMGFCLFSNAAIAAEYALTKAGIDRVGILDWDVHHGNGTEAIVQSNPQIAFCSLHQFPCYPGTGRPSDKGMYDNVLNLPMAIGSTVVEYRQAFENEVIPFMTRFKPDLLIVSAGYDANEDDPLAEICLQPQDYGLFTDYCLQLTQHILFGLEGGYDLNALARSVMATIKACLD